MTAPAHAYDIAWSPSDPGADPALHGWVGGTPRGINPTGWPLDPSNGYPMKHGFTLRLPQDYQVRGEGIVAIAFFGPAPEFYDGGPLVIEGMAEVVLGTGPEPRPGTDLRAIWDHARKAHPRLHRFEDILGGSFAILDLTETDLSGAHCPFPGIADLAIFKELERPSFSRTDGDPLHPIRMTIRKGDPNVGIIPEERPGPGSSYERRFDENFKLKPWAKGLAHTHLGGTAQPFQAYPDLTPFYLEFPEAFGGFNFGSGNAQLCLKTLVFDWAC